MSLFTFNSVLPPPFTRAQPAAHLCLPVIFCVTCLTDSCLACLCSVFAYNFLCSKSVHLHLFVLTIKVFHACPRVPSGACVSIHLYFSLGFMVYSFLSAPSLLRAFSATFFLFLSPWTSVSLICVSLLCFLFLLSSSFLIQVYLYFFLYIYIFPVFLKHVSLLFCFLFSILRYFLFTCNFSLFIIYVLLHFLSLNVFWPLVCVVAFPLSIVRCHTSLLRFPLPVFLFSLTISSLFTLVTVLSTCYAPFFALHVILFFSLHSSCLLHVGHFSPHLLIPFLCLTRHFSIHLVFAFLCFTYHFSLHLHSLFFASRRSPFPSLALLSVFCLSSPPHLSLHPSSSSSTWLLFLRRCFGPPVT